MRDLRAAAAVMRSIVGDKKGNLDRTRRLVFQAADLGAELVLFPEASLTGYTVRQSMRAWAEPVPGPLTEALAILAREAGLVIAAGLVEAGRGNNCWLTQVMVGPQGLIGTHRKTHLGLTEKDLFQPGDKLAVWEYDGVTYGVQLCYEGHFPEISLAQALQGAEVILVPHASPREDPQDKLERWLRYLPARAYDNSVFLLACNPAGDNGQGLTFAGAALILGPKGQVLAQWSGEHETIVRADLPAADLAAVRESKMGFFLPSRRPDLYSTQ